MIWRSAAFKEYPWPCFPAGNHYTHDRTDPQHSARTQPSAADLPGSAGLFLFRHNSLFCQIAERCRHGALRGRFLPLRAIGDRTASSIVAFTQSAMENGGLGDFVRHFGWTWLGRLRQCPGNRSGDHRRCALHDLPGIHDSDRLVVVSRLAIQTCHERCIDGDHGRAAREFPGRGRTPPFTSHVESH